MNSPYRSPGAVDPPPSPRRWGATRYRKWLYRYVEQVVGLMDALQFFTIVVVLDKDPRIIPHTSLADRRVIVRGILRSSSRRGTNE